MMAKRFPTKIIPPHFDNIFPRESLYKRVEEHLRTPLIWVNGPPGAGKTVFVVSLLEKRHSKFLWYRVDQREKNATDIFYFLPLAAQRNSPRTRLNLPVFTAEYGDDSESFARVFFRHLYAGLKNESAIVFDNCQDIEQDASFFSILQMAVNELPQGLQIFCVSRNKPASALNRMRLSHDLLEIGADDLCFNDRESRAFLKWLTPQINEQTIQYLQVKARGWAAGMVLLSEQCGHQDLSAIPPDVRDNQILFEYLATEILDQLENEVREFLVKSAIFSHMTAEMGEKLSGCCQTRQILNDLVGKNCLIERSADTPTVYTYHPLLQELLLTQAHSLFSEAEWRTLQAQAAKILITQDRAIEAISLYQQLEDWQAAKKLLLQQTESLIKAGRHRAANKLIRALPVDVFEADAWLNYWYAQSIKPVEPKLAESLLDNCYDQFIADNDVVGIYSTWQAAVESICLGLDDFSRFEIWLNRFDELRKKYPVCPTVELKIKYCATAVHALTLYNPEHPWLKGLVRIVERLIHLIPINIVPVMIHAQLGHYYVLTGQLAKFQHLVPFLQASADDQTLPAMPRILSAFLLGMQNQYHANRDEISKYLNKALELSDHAGINLYRGLIELNLINFHIFNNDLSAAEDILKISMNLPKLKQHLLTGLHHSCAAWIDALKGEINYAYEQNQLGLQTTQKVNIKVGVVFSLAFKVQLLAEMQQWQKAQQTFSRLQKTIEGTENRFYLIQYHLTNAWLGYLQGDQDRALSAIRQFFQIACTENMLFFFGWRPDVMKPLCVLAIEHGIEEDFAIRMLQNNPLSSASPVNLEKWPWPIRIYCFEQLQIEIDGKRIEHSGKSQKKILELLLAIIALGGREVASQSLSEVLWPDSDGDFAFHALETAIHRLRKLIGKQSITVKSGRVSINDTVCWIDLWAFEQAAKDLIEELNGSARPEIVIQLTDRLLQLYRGAFPIQEDLICTKFAREQWQNRLFNLIDQMADYHEQRLENDRARYLLERKLQIDPSLESSYLRLILHYKKLGQTSSALRIFEQCERTLSDGLGITLSAKIKSLVS